MFNKDSAFTPDPEVVDHMKKVLGKEPRPDHVEKQSTEKQSAYSLLTAARMMLDIESYDAATQLIDEAIEALEE
jgi:hypothetical protein